MQTILTPRLALVRTPLSVLQTRLRQETFVADIDIAGEMRAIIFPVEWPGDGIVLFPLIIDVMQSGHDAVAWGGTVIHRAENIAVGQIGCKGFPGAFGEVEIGYGFNESYRNRGYATEMVSAFTEWLLTRSEVTRVIADCRPNNIGSARVLEKCGFARMGFREDEEDGTLIAWERRREA